MEVSRLQEFPLVKEKLIKFWARQFAEHQIIINAGLAEIKGIRGAPPTQLAEGQPLAKKLKDQSAQLATRWLEVHKNNNVNLDQLQKLTEQTIEFQEQAMKLAFDGVWVGWLSYTFLEHINGETRYFYAKVFGGEPFTYQTEVPFWLWHNETEIAYSAQLLDAKEETLRHKADNLVHQVQKLEQEIARYRQGTPVTLLPQIQQSLSEFLSMNRELLEGIRNRKILTNLSVDMVEHVIREALFAALIFRWLAFKEGRGQLGQELINRYLMGMEAI